MTVKKKKKTQTLIRLDRLESRGLLRNFSWPTTLFDSAKPWKASYQVHMISHLRADPKSYGYFTVSQISRSSANARLQIDMDVSDVKDARFQLNASLTTTTSPLLSPVSWKVKSKLTSPDGVLLPETKQTQEGSIKDEHIITRINGYRHRRKVEGQLATDYGLYAAIMGLSGNFKKAEFTLLEDYIMLKPSQQLLRSEDHELSFKGEARKLRSFLLAGYGIMPIEYFVDELTGVLVFSCTGLGCNVYCQDAPKLRSQQKRKRR